MYYLPPDTANRISVERLAGATFTTVQDYINFFGDRVIITGGEITATLPADGTVAVAACTAWCKETDSDIAIGVFLDFAGVGNIALTDLTVNVLYLDYNAGTPQVVVATSPLTFGFQQDHILLGAVYRNGNATHIVNSDRLGIQGINRTHLQLVEHGPHRTSGMAALAAGVRNLTVTAGVLHLGLIRINTPARDTTPAGGDTFTYWYYDGSLPVPAWVAVPGSTQISNTQYNNVALGLVNFTPNRYGVHWVFMDFDGHLEVVYGQGNYKAAQAENADVPAPLPNVALMFSVIVAKIICQEGTDVLTISYPWTIPFLSALANDHSLLFNLAADDHVQYLNVARHDLVARHPLAVLDPLVCSEAEAAAIAAALLAIHAALPTVHQDAPALIAVHAALPTIHQDAPALIAVHAALPTVHQDAPAIAAALIAIHAALPTVHQDAPAIAAALIAIHAALTAAGVHGSSVAAAINTLIHRDAAGRAKIVDPAVAADIDNLGARNAAIATHAALSTNVHGIQDTPLFSTEAKTYYIDAVNGDDGNSGEASDEAFKTWAKAKTMIPMFIMHDYEVITLGDVPEGIVLEGRTTKLGASLSIKGDKESVLYYAVNRIVVFSCSGDIRVQYLRATVNGIFIGYSMLPRVNGIRFIHNDATINYAFELEACIIALRDCDVGAGQATDGIFANNCRMVSHDVSGNATRYGLYAINSAVIGKRNGQPTGATANEHTAHGGVIR